MRAFIRYSLIFVGAFYFISCNQDDTSDLDQIESQNNLQEVQSFEELIINSSEIDLLQNDYRRENQEVIQNYARSGITLYNSRINFMNDCPELQNEDFENSNFSVFGTCSPSISSVDNGCYSEGELISGFTLSDDPTQTTIVITAGVFGNATTIVGPNDFNSNLTISFSDAETNAVGFDIVDVLGGQSWNLSVNGMNGLLWSGVVSGSLTGNFMGFSVIGDHITNLEFTSLGGFGAELIDNLTFGNCCIEVEIDIKPGNPNNSIRCTNPNTNILVALLSTSEFDATSVDHTTVTFEGASERHVNGQGNTIRHEVDIDGDGDLDLLFHFKFSDTTLDCNSTQGTLQGLTFDGQCIYGTDIINMR